MSGHPPSPALASPCFSPTITVKVRCGHCGVLGRLVYNRGTKDVHTACTQPAVILKVVSSSVLAGVPETLRQHTSFSKNIKAT